MQNLEQLAREYRNALENSAQDGSSVIEQIIILEENQLDYLNGLIPRLPASSRRTANYFKNIVFRSLSKLNALIKNTSYVPSFRNVNVPSAEECFARVQIFSECREHFRTAADVALCRAEKMKERYYRAGGKKPVFRTGALEEAYSLSAELSPMLSVAALERDFGLLPHMRGGAYGVKTGANV